MEIISKRIKNGFSGVRVDGSSRVFVDVGQNPELVALLSTMSATNSGLSPTFTNTLELPSTLTPEKPFFMFLLIISILRSYEKVTPIVKLLDQSLLLFQNTF